MNLFEKILYFLQYEIERPKSYGLFHIVCVLLCLLVTIFVCLKKEKNHEKSLKRILLIYSIITIVLEVLKQVVWSFNYDPVTGSKYFDYMWYAFPFQLCSMPMYLCLISAFLKKGKVRDSILSSVAYFTILGSLATIVYPESCFVRTLLVDIHTMYLHLGSFVVSVYLISREINKDFKSLFKGFVVFLICASLALILNITFYKLNIINGETFNMFYISPYFKCSLPLLDIIYDKVPYILFLVIYISLVFIGALIVYLISKIFNKKQR